MSVGEIVDIVLSILSFLLAAISVVTVIITLKQNKKMIENNSLQLKEMQEEYRLSIQPLLEFQNAGFRLDRPRFFYSPPEDEYAFLSRYRFKTELKNISQVPAICIDVTAILYVFRDNDKKALKTITRRISAISGNNEKAAVEIMFPGDSIHLLYEALRENSTKYLPQITVMATYKNACGGCFLCEKTFILMLSEEDEATARAWHTAMSSEKIRAKEVIRELQLTRETDDTRWECLFESEKSSFDEGLGNPEVAELNLNCREIAEKYNFKVLSKEEYEKYSEDYHYGHFIYKQSHCPVKKQIENKAAI